MWHYFLGGLNSGFMYYGTSLDMEVKPTIACNRALDWADPVIAASSADHTPPTIWQPQRYPWNPGGLNFGPQHNYQQCTLSGDFWVWTSISDVSGVQQATLKYRVDADGQNPLSSTQNETYGGGPEVGAWQSVPMTRRAFPAGNVYNDPSIDFYVMPRAIADHYHARITGLSNVLADYYVEAVDTRGNVRRSSIDHVYVGNANVQPPGRSVCVSPGAGPCRAERDDHVRPDRPPACGRGFRAFALRLWRLVHGDLPTRR